MKKVLLLAVVFFTACTKPNNMVGPAGPQGLVGPTGTNGTVIYSGATVPDGSVGSNGDFYLDLTSHILYGPKTASGWGTGFSMIGPTGTAGATGATGASGTNGAAGAPGAAGANGSQIYAGTGLPSASLGTIGDYYLEKDSAYLYGPKQAGGWGTPITLQGNANVEYTPWFAVGNTTADTVWGTTHVFFDQPVPAISDDVINKGMVITFAMLNGYYTNLYAANQVQQMPVSLTYNGMTDTWSSIVTPGNVRIDFINSKNFYTALGGASIFRCVIVPGGVSIPDALKGSALLRYLRVPE